MYVRLAPTNGKILEAALRVVDWSGVLTLSWQTQVTGLENSLKNETVLKISVTDYARNRKL